MEKQFPTARELWKLPSMAPPCAPVFISPPHPPRRSSDPVKQSSDADQPDENGAAELPARGRSIHAGDEITPISGPPHLRDIIRTMPLSKEDTGIPQPPATPNSLDSNADTIAVQSPSTKFGMAPPPVLNGMHSTNGYGIGLALPIRNRRMTSPVAGYRRMSVSATHPLGPSFSAPTVIPTFQNGAILSNSRVGFQIRNPIDLLEAIQAHPDKTFVNIRALGNENIRLKHDFLVLKQESEYQMERERKHAENMNATILQLLSTHTAMHSTLQKTIERLQNEVCRLKGGGQIVNGIWLHDEEYAVASHMVTSGKVTWHDYITNKVAAYRKIRYETLNRGEEVKRFHGRARTEELPEHRTDTFKSAWNPHAQSFVPSLESSSSPTKSDVTEIFNPSPKRASTVPTNAVLSLVPSARSTFCVSSHQDNQPAPTYASVLGPHPPLPPVPTTVPHGSILNSQYRPLSTIPAYQPKHTSPRSPYNSYSPTRLLTTSESSLQSKGRIDSPISYSPTRVPTASGFLIPTPPTESPIPEAVLAMISDSLPPYFRAICPFSLTGFQRCPRSDCPMKKLCKEYNDERNNPENNATRYMHGMELCEGSVIEDIGLKTHSMKALSAGSGHDERANDMSQWPMPGKNSCAAPSQPIKLSVTLAHTIGKEEFCPNKRCQGLHEYATCISDLAEENGGTLRIKSKGGWRRCTNNTKWHLRKRAHRSWGVTGPEEWKHRETIAGLREAHKEGRYF